MVGKEIGTISKDPVEIVGTVTNLGMQPATNVDVTGIFYDQNHTVVDSQDDYVNIGYDIKPREKANFDLQPVLNTQNHNNIKSVALNVQSLEYSMFSNSNATQVPK
jgi:hypothetical protein